MSGHDGYTPCERCALMMHLHGPEYYCKGQAMLQGAIEMQKAAIDELKEAREAHERIVAVSKLLCKALGMKDIEKQTTLIKKASDILASVKENQS